MCCQINVTQPFHYSDGSVALAIKAAFVSIRRTWDIRVLLTRQSVLLSRSGVRVGMEGHHVAPHIVLSAESLLTRLDFTNVLPDAGRIVYIKVGG